MKIIRITEENVLVGTDDGQVLEIKKSDLDFEPKFGMEVEKYTSGNEIIIIPKQIPVEEKPEKIANNLSVEEALKKGIVVNVANNNNTSNDNFDGYVQSGKVVNKVAYVLLAFFLGGIGFHKFYAGRVFAGIMCLLFCWTFIPCIVAFFEAIFACFKPSDSRGRIIV